MAFAVVDEGLPDAHNTLLRGPSLLAANDGPFRQRDRDGLHQAVGGSKTGDAAKIGRFGIGLKSVFHICEAFVYLGAEHRRLRPGALNPWVGTGEARDADPRHPDWDTVESPDLQVLQNAARDLLGSFDNGLLLWLPLRRAEHLDRGEGGKRYGVGSECLESETVAAWLSRNSSLALLLAQCGHLHSIEAHRVPTPEKWDHRTSLIQIVRPNFESGAWVGRYSDDDHHVRQRWFAGKIQDRKAESPTASWTVTGIDTIGHDGLRRLRSGPSWPSDQEIHGGRIRIVPRKALAHAAITVLRKRLSDDIKERTLGVRLRWAVFLPLDDDPGPSSSTPIVETACAGDTYSWDIVLHGYFWPSQDRRSIPGVTDNDDSMTGHETRMRAEWNRRMRDELLLPLLPRALAEAVEAVCQDAAWKLLKGIASTTTVGKHLASITRRDVVLPVLTKNGVCWKAYSASGVRVLAVPSWKDSPPTVRAAFMQETERIHGVIFVDQDSPGVGGESDDWTAHDIRCLLNCISIDVLRKPRELAWVATCIRHLLVSQDGQERLIAVAGWIAEQIGGGALVAATDGSSDIRDALRKHWLAVFEALPAAWLLHTGVRSGRAVAELARAGIVGAGFLPVPFGVPSHTPASSQRTPHLLGRALQELGRRLAYREDVSPRIRHSRLVLAEAILAAYPGRWLDKDNHQLPILRAVRLPDDEDEAWSVEELERQTALCRVFARTQGEAEGPADHRQAGLDLTQALGESVWLVDEAVAALATAPVPPATSREALGEALLHATAIRSAPPQRARLIKRLAEHGSSPNVRAALRVLLTGEACARDDCDLYIRSTDNTRESDQTTLEILLNLRGQKWRSVGPELLARLQTVLVDQLRIKTVDARTLQRLLSEVLRTTDIQWHSLGQAEVLHLLRHLFGTDPDDHKRWRAMPVHRDTNGDRGPIAARTWRATGQARLPSDLKEEVHVIDPDPEVADLYLDVRPMDDDGILSLMLESDSPDQYARQILDKIWSDSTTGQERFNLPRDGQLLDRLRRSRWLPSYKNRSTGLAPAAMIDLPQELWSFVAPLSSAIGEHRFPEAVDASIWPRSKDIIHEILGRPDPVEQVCRLANALNTNAVLQVDSGSYVILPHAEDVNMELIEDALQSPLAGSHSGWRLVQSVATAVTSLVGRERACRAILALSISLTGPVPIRQQESMLKSIGDSRPNIDSASGRLFLYLCRSFANAEGFFERVLPAINLPTQDAQWRAASDVSRSAFVARRHRVVDGLRSVLERDRHSRSEDNLSCDLEHITSKTHNLESSHNSSYRLHLYFEDWKNRVPDGAICAFLSLLENGRDNRVLRLAERWRDRDFGVSKMRIDLSDAIEVRCKKIDMLVSKSESGDRVRALNVLDEWVKMHADPHNGTIFATEPAGTYTRGRESWKMVLRDVDPKNRTNHELILLLERSVDWWAHRVFRLQRRRVQDWWKKWTGSQLQVARARVPILSHLPYTLLQLGVQECTALRDAMENARRAQMRRSWASNTAIWRAREEESSALKRLEDLVTNHGSPHRSYLRNRVRDAISIFGYSADNVLFELIQNADDALAQESLITGGELPRSTRRVIIRVHDIEDRTVVDFTHYGRPINDTGGAAFPEGEDRQWDQDLYFMMLLNLSGKPGERPRQSTATSTTGRFGLGFKSVHLISDDPLIVSGFLAFSIAGGLLPEERPVPSDPDLTPVDGHRATRIRMPLRSDRDAERLVDKTFRRFYATHALLPVFTRKILEVVVYGGRYAGVNVFDAIPVDRAPGWAVAKETSELPGHGAWRVLRFRPSDAGIDAGTAALVVGLRNGMPTPFPSELPFLWNVAPTSAGWGCGYAVNGPFKLDPGRTHVALDHEGTLRVAEQLGDALGKGLTALHDALDAGLGRAIGLPVSEADVTSFVTELWKLLTSGIENRIDTFRHNFLLRLHGADRGISAWMRDRSVVPSGLSAPFRKRLPPLQAEMKIERAVRGLDDSDLCASLTQTPDLVNLAQGHLAVTGGIAQRLRPLWHSRLPDLEPVDIFRELAEKWNHSLTPARLHALRPFVSDRIWKMTCGLQKDLWCSRLLARSVKGEFVPLTTLLIRNNHGAATPEVADEVRRAEFAPNHHILDDTYIIKPSDVAMFLRLRVRHRIDAEIMAGWFIDLDEQRRPASLQYLLHGSLHREVLGKLARSARRPPWLMESDGVRRMLYDMQEDDWQRQSLHAALFPSYHEIDESAPSARPSISARVFFERFQTWWDSPEERRRVLQRCEEEAWPGWLRHDGIDNGLRSDSSEHHWLALLVLGSCRGLGRTRDHQHRRFLELAYEEGWWNVFVNPDAPDAWMEMLRTWQDKAVDNLEYSHWMSLFPTIYQLSRYLSTYRRLLCTANRRNDLDNIKILLAPRVDEELTFAGRTFDAPPAPLDMGVHWVLRELFRLQIIDGDHLLPDCWVQSRQVTNFLIPLGLEHRDGASNSEKARAIFDFLAERLDTAAPHLHRSFDIPLRHIATDKNLQQKLGLED